MPSPAEYFSRLPPEFVCDWLPARVENLRWPPDTNRANWTRVLGDAPDRWRNYEWTIGSIDLSTAVWCAQTSNTIRDLATACFGTASTASWRRHASHGLDKIQRIQAYAMTHRVLPGRLLISRTPSGLFLTDGYHRVTWFGFTSRLMGPAFPISPIAECYFGEPQNA
jgi:hypothetical protein